MEPSRSITCYKAPASDPNADLISAQNYLLGLLSSSGQQLSQEIQKTTQVTQEVIPQLQSRLEDVMNENTRLRKYIVVLESEQTQLMAAQQAYNESLEQEITLLQQSLENTRREFTEYKEKSENTLKKAIESKDEAVQLVSKTAEARLLAIKEQLKLLVSDTYIGGHSFDSSKLNDLKKYTVPRCSCHSYNSSNNFYYSLLEQNANSRLPQQKITVEQTLRKGLAENLVDMRETIKNILSSQN